MYQFSMAAYPGKRVVDVMNIYHNEQPCEPMLGPIQKDHVQVCPQNFGLVDEEACDILKSQSPLTRYRLHANAKVHRSTRPYMGDASDLHKEDRQDHFESIIRIQRYLGSNPYSIHAGDRSIQPNLDSLRTNVLKFQDKAGFKVAVEGLYPEKGNKWLISDWDEYEWLMNSGLYFALDLSHLNIVAKRKKELRLDLVKEMVQHPNCAEIHVSDNNGFGDSHQVCTRDTWWMRLLEESKTTAVVFSEGNQLSKDRARNLLR